MAVLPGWPRLPGRQTTDAGAPATYATATWLFLRLLGVVYLFAFWSLAQQVIGLMGQDGILPVTEYRCPSPCSPVSSGSPCPARCLLLGALEPLRSVNPYGLFAVMTTARDEIVVEGSRDGFAALGRYEGEAWLPLHGPDERSISLDDRTPP